MPTKRPGETDARFNTRRALRMRKDAKLYESLGMGDTLQARASHGAADHFSRQAAKAVAISKRKK